MPFLGNKYRLFRLWYAFSRIALVREMEFRGNFLSGIVRQMLWAAGFVLLIKVIYQHTSSLAGWSEIQVLILLALSRIIEGTSDAVFGRSIGDIPAAIQSGRFDFYLAKPTPVQFHAAFRRLRLLDFGNTFVGVILLLYCVYIDPTIFSFTNIGLFVVLALVGIIIYYSILMLLVALVFFFERLDSFAAITHFISEPLTYPFDIFPGGVKIVLTYLIPIAFVVFVPAQALTGRLDWWQLPLAILLATLFLTLANLAWRAGLRRYSSASS